MAGNKKSSSRKPTVKANKKKIVGHVFNMNLLSDYSAPRRPELMQLASIAEHSVNRLSMDDNPTFVDWMNVLHRIYIGQYMYRHYWQFNADVENLFDEATHALRLVKVRAHVNGMLGLTYSELQSVKFGLDATLDISHAMSNVEIMAIHAAVERLLDTVSEAPRGYADKIAALLPPTEPESKQCVLAIA